jgi:hypothetical protein
MDAKTCRIWIYAIILLSTAPLFAADNEALIAELEGHPARSAVTWSEYAGKDIKSRILPAPDIIIDYLRKDNQLQGYPELPKRPQIDPEFLSDIVSAVAGLPDAVRNHIHEHVAAIFLVEELGGSAYGELLREFDKNKLGFIVLDVGSLNRKANEWISWRENSPFSGKSTYTLHAEIEEKSNDSRAAAIQYILLHEIGHLVGAAKGAHPNWLTGDHPQNWPFTKASWSTWDGGFKGKSKYDETFVNRSKLKFYSFQDAPLTSREMDETYGQLLKTDFVSLYAATNMYDDFAETYSMYVHVVLQNRHWKIRITKEAEAVREIKDPILDQRCESKRRYLDKMFQ